MDYQFLFQTMVQNLTNDFFEAQEHHNSVVSLFKKKNL